MVSIHGNDCFKLRNASKTFSGRAVHGPGMEELIRRMFPHVVDALTSLVRDIRRSLAGRWSVMSGMGLTFISVYLHVATYTVHAVKRHNSLADFICHRVLYAYEHENSTAVVLFQLVFRAARWNE